MRRVNLPTAAGDLESPSSCKKTKLVRESIPNYYSDIPSEDIIVSEILTRLPVKSLLKFRCVSKSWCSLISYDTVFIESHLKKSTNNKSFSHHAIIASVDELKYAGAPHEDCIKLNQYSFSSWFYEPSKFATRKFSVIGDNLSPPRGCEVVGCSNGLCCLQNRHNGLKQDDFFLWNPATGKSHKLPPAYVESAWTWGHYTLAGFGFDEVHHDYKVLAVQFSAEDGVVTVRLYSSRTNSWKPVQNSFKSKTDFDGFSAKFLNGKLHWVGSPSLTDHNVKMIYCFDLEKEVHGMVEKPPNFDRDSWFPLSIGVLDGCLSCIINIDYQALHVWVMKHYGMKESWNRVVISISENIRFDTDSTFNPLWIGQGGEILFNDIDSVRFVLYDPKTKSYKCLRWPCRIRSIEADVYVQSLVSPVPAVNAVPCS